MSHIFLTIKENNNLDKLDWLQAMFDIEKKDISLLEGDIASKDNILNGNNDLTMNTLDEPVMNTLFRDLTSIFTKIKNIVFPFTSNNDRQFILRDWDLWGPLLFCTFLALTLHHEPHDNQLNQSGPHFAEIFILFWLGSSLISINFKLLSLSTSLKAGVSSSKLFIPSFFQLLCVFGYCLSPPCLGICLLNIFKLFLSSGALFYFKILIGSLSGFVWPTISCCQILFKFQEPDKRPLYLYPIALFYFAVSWIIITSH